MIDLEYIVKTSLMLLLKRIIGIFLIILLLAELIVLFCKGASFLNSLDCFLTTEYNISLYYSSGVFAVSYWFFYFVKQLLEFFSIRIWIWK